MGTMQKSWEKAYLKMLIVFVEYFMLFGLDKGLPQKLVDFFQILPMLVFVVLVVVVRQ